jgi:hypothetical protein
MYKNQFYFEIPQQDGTVRIGSLSLDKVVSTAEYEKGAMVIIMNDYRNEMTEKPFMKKNGQYDTQRVKEDVSTRIFLTAKDSARYRALTEVDAPLPADYVEPEYPTVTSGYSNIPANQDALSTNYGPNEITNTEYEHAI